MRTMGPLPLRMIQRYRGASMEMLIILYQRWTYFERIWDLDVNVLDGDVKKRTSGHESSYAFRLFRGRPSSTYIFH